MEEEKFIKKKQKLVFLTGAGISAESGLGTFRGNNGLWGNYAIEDVASIEGFLKDPALVLSFYNMRRQQCKNAQPNAAHFGLAELETTYDVQIITQNIDDLHERAGSSHVLHLHGEIMKIRSVKNDRRLFPISEDIHLGDMAADGGQLRPDVVWFGEAVPKIEDAIHIIHDADIFVIIGTSLAVYPAAGLIDYLATSVPIYVLDKEIPYINRKNIIRIEKSATQGIIDLCQALQAK